MSFRKCIKSYNYCYIYNRTYFHHPRKFPWVPRCSLPVTFRLWWPQICFYYCFPFLEFCIDGLLPYAVSCVWLLLLSIMLWGSCSSLLWSMLNGISQCRYTTVCVFIHSQIKSGLVAQLVGFFFFWGGNYE